MVILCQETNQFKRDCSFYSNGIISFDSQSLWKEFYFSEIAVSSLARPQHSALFPVCLCRTVCICNEGRVLIVICLEACQSWKTLLNLAGLTSSSLSLLFRVTMESHYWCERTIAQHLLPFPTPLRYLCFLLSVSVGAVALWCCCRSATLLAAGSAGFLRRTLRWSTASYWLPAEDCGPHLFCFCLIFLSLYGPPKQNVKHELLIHLVSLCVQLDTPSIRTKRIFWIC